jgi:hypothetical protein
MTTINDLLNHVQEHHDKIDIQTANEAITSTTDLYLKTCIVNCWTKLDEYFTILNNTPTHYASVVTVPYMKWKYFEHTWKDAKEWKDAKAPETWLPSRKKALDTLWEEYQYLPFET